MTNEKKYALLTKMIREYDDAAKLDGLGEKMIQNPALYTRDPFFPFLAAAAELLLDVQAAMDRGTTSAETLAALKRIYNSCPPYRPAMYGFFRSGDMWALCDGFRFVRLHDKPGSIPEAPEAAEGNPPIDLEKIAHDALVGAEDVELPAAGQIKAYIAEQKAKHGSKKTRWDKYEALPGWWCDPQFLLDLVQALPGASAVKAPGPLKPVYLKSENGDGLLLPVKPPQVQA